jgi:hypothetical protein
MKLVKFVILNFSLRFTPNLPAWRNPRNNFISLVKEKILEIEKELRDKLLDILDVCYGYTRQMDDVERLEIIKEVVELILDDATQEDKRRRFWVYKRDDWEPEKLRHKLLYFGGDEFHRHTIVIPWFTGYLVVALWRFRGPRDCFVD